MTVADLEHRPSQNPASPLFARLAKEYLTAGRIREAKHLCLVGLQRYRTYATAHLILARCFHAEQQFTKALEYVEQARTFFPDSTYLKSLADEWKNQEQERPAVAIQEVPAILPILRIPPASISCPSLPVTSVESETDDSAVAASSSPSVGIAEVSCLGDVLAGRFGVPAVARVETRIEFPADPSVVKFPTPGDGGRIVSKTLA